MPVSKSEKAQRRNRLFNAVGHKSSFNEQANIQINKNDRVIHPNLPIIAPDFSYVMDIFDMDVMQMQEAEVDHKKVKNIKIESDDENEDIDKAEGMPEELPKKIANLQLKNKKRVHGTDHGYRYLLVLIDTTSRKVWMYPLRTKNKHEVESAFKEFLNDVNGKIARLLSDADTAFADIAAHNKYYTYVQVVASHGNHTTLSRIDTFARTFREMLNQYYADFVRDGSGKDFSWYDSYELLRDAYNDTRHGGLKLIDTKNMKKHPEFLDSNGDVSLDKCMDPNKDGRVRHKYYTPNQVWNNAKLRSRIRLQYYLSKRSNYDKIYKKIADADYVRIRIQNDKINKGKRSGYFSNTVFTKGKKRGNSWNVNGRYVTYRNILPVGKKEDLDKFGKPDITKMTKAIRDKLAQYIEYYTYNSEETGAVDKNKFISARRKRKQKEIDELTENKRLQPAEKKRKSIPSKKYDSETFMH